jgi:hypothetical protein
VWLSKRRKLIVLRILDAMVLVALASSGAWAQDSDHFELNGKIIGGPPPRPLAPYAVNVRGDQIVVSKDV